LIQSSNQNRLEPPSRFTRIDTDLAHTIAREFGSPVYLFDIPGMLNWLQQFQGDAKRLYQHSTIAVSVKTNPLAGLLQRLGEHGAAAEVISGDEFQLARHLGFDYSDIIFNGPAKRDAELTEAVKGGCRIHCDHPGEIDRIEDIARRLNVIAKIGIRVYSTRPGNFNRFGFAMANDRSNDQACEALLAAKRIFDSPFLTFGGIHAHIGTNVRQLQRFEQLGKDLCKFATLMRGHFGFDLSWINVGGGLPGISPTNDEAEETNVWPVACTRNYARAVITPLLPYLNTSEAETELLFEPGRSLFDPWGAMLMTVVGIRPASEHFARGVILDAGITSLALSEKMNHPLHVCKDTGSPNQKESLTHFWGPTCMQRDECHRPEKAVDLQPGDHLLLYGTGGYSTTMAIPFVNFRSGVLGWEKDDQFFWLRHPETLQHKMLLENVGVRTISPAPGTRQRSQEIGQ